MPGSRRLPRSLRNTIPAMLATFAGDMSSEKYESVSPLDAPTEHAAAPKHFPFPSTPVDDDLFFEFLMFLFTVTSAGLQFVHLYRTVWWLPHSYTSQAINVYLIDPFLVLFIVILLSRRLLFLIGCRALEKLAEPKFVLLACVCYRYLLFGLMFGLLSFCAYFVVRNLPMMNFLYLSYPFLIYLILFGFEISPTFELVPWDAASLPPLHACRLSAPEVRDEVENLRINFNHRLKQILFNSVLNAYYTGFIPCCFAPTHLHYDIMWATQHVIFVCLSSFCASVSHFMSLRYCDILHRSALHLGAWSKLEARNMILQNSQWDADVLFPYAALVKHGSALYRAQGECNASEPGNGNFSRFYTIFRNPSSSMCFVTLAHVAVVLYQLAVLLYCTMWYNTISISLMLFFNYYVMYKLGRDCLVGLKMYEEEREMHNKMTLGTR